MSFGSFLERDDFRDIDVALLVSEKLSSYKALKLAMHIGSELDFGIKIGHDFDVRVLNNAHPEFQYEVVKTGIAVISRDEQERFDYEADVISTYLDLKEMYDFFDRETWQRLNASLGDERSSVWKLVGVKAYEILGLKGSSRWLISSQAV